MTLCGVGGVELLKEEGHIGQYWQESFQLDEIHEIYEKDRHGAGVLCTWSIMLLLFGSVPVQQSPGEAEAAIGAVVHSHVVWPIRPLTMEKYFRQRAGSLSPKDLCALDLIPQIAEAGVYSPEDRRPHEAS